MSKRVTIRQIAALLEEPLGTVMMWKSKFKTASPRFPSPVGNLPGSGQGRGQSLYDLHEVEEFLREWGLPRKRHDAKLKNFMQAASSLPSPNDYCWYICRNDVIVGEFNKEERAYVQLIGIMLEIGSREALAAADKLVEYKMTLNKVTVDGTLWLIMGCERDLISQLDGFQVDMWTNWKS